jgi:DNA repair protein RecO (recombination protein O)
MPVQKTHAIVIRAYPLGEYDKIITFYTAEFGKVRAVARGMRRPKSRLGGSLELLNYGALVFYERTNKDLHVINDFDLIDGFDAVKADFDRTTYGCYLAELVNVIESEHSADQGVFHLLLRGFEALGETQDIRLLARAFELKFLDLAGFAPQLARCVACASPTLNPSLRFSPRLGGLLCVDCSTKDPNAISIVRGSCELMKHLRKSDLLQLNRLRASERNHRELKFVLSSFIAYHTERRLKSLEFIDGLEM